jgi:putative transposase
MSRVVNGDYIFGEEEKEFFRRTMRKLERFMGLQILTYCVMSNHFHILVGVPEQDTLSDEALLSRLKEFYSAGQYREIEQLYYQAKAHADKTGNEAWLEEFRAQYLSRIGNLSSFLKELKERMSKWYNRRHQRRGTLWEERFKSVLVENSDHALLTMAAYIDLNPVRAGLAGDPKEYRFCGYAEAMGGKTEARSGLVTLLQQSETKPAWPAVAAQYRRYLFFAGEERAGRKGFTSEQVQEVLDNNGALPLYDLLRCHVRYFNDGVALGSRRFLEEVFSEHREHFGIKRKEGCRPMKGGDWQGLFCMRALRRAPISAHHPAT